MRAFRPRDIFHLRRLSDVAIAPDGLSVAYTLHLPDTQLDGYRTCIYRLGADERGPRPLTRGPADQRPWFSPDGHHLAFRRREGDAAQVHLLPLAGGEALQLTALRYGVDAFAWGPHGRQIAALATVGPSGPTARQLYRFDLDGTWRQLSDDAFEHRDPTFAPDGRHIACLLERPGGVAIGVVPVDGGAWRLLTPWWARWARPVYAPDGGSIYAIGAAAGADPALWRVGLAAGDPEAVAESPWPGALLPYLRGEGASVRDLFVTGDGQNLLGLLQDRREAIVARCHLGSGRWQPEHLEGYRIHAFASTASGHRMALLGGPPGQPPEALLRDESGRIALRSDHHELFLVDAGFAPLQPLGDAVPGSGLLPPPSPPDGRVPLVVVLGDRPDPATGGSSSLLAQALCGRGLAVLSLPLDRDLAAAADGDPQRLIGTVRAGVALSAARLDIDAARLGIVGEGVGGYLSLLLLAQTGDFRAAATLGAATDLLSLWGSGDLPGATALADLPPPWQDPQRYLSLSPLLQAPRITAPLLLVQGSDDRVVPALQAAELCKALESLGRPVRLKRYQGLDHRPLAEQPLRLQAQILELLAGWLVDHLAQ